jgi:hypothetical protein
MPVRIYNINMFREAQKPPIKKNLKNWFIKRLLGILALRYFIVRFYSFDCQHS